MTSTKSTTVLSRVVFPAVAEPDVIPLYLDADEWTEVGTVPLRLSHKNAVTMVSGRRSLTVPAGERVSLASYFNAFPASYWRRWTNLLSVRLSIRTEGDGDVIVYRSNARGVIQTVTSAHVSGGVRTDFDLSLSNFLDGGWYWFDLVARKSPLALIEADWVAPEDAKPVTPGPMSISVTTLNRTAYCLALLDSLASEDEVVDGLTEITVVDQGTERIRDHDLYAPLAAKLGGKLRVIEQANVGGSGGFSRGMIEAERSGRSSFVMLLDDDVAIDPEGVRRAHVFSQFCENPTIVGGHMFDMYDKTKLHSFAEGVNNGDFLWGSHTPTRHDLESMNLRQTEWIHRRFDVDYNGWWMSVIPVSVIREIGLSLPVFIKWDDAEYSLRARSRGIRTVSLPGSSVWHVSWVDKDDSRDWQAYFHARNRLITALLHSPVPRGGRLTTANLASDIRHLLTLDYFTVSLRQQAFRDVLRGPDSLHAELETRLGAIKEEAARSPETTLHKAISDFPNFPATGRFTQSHGDNSDRPRGARHWVRFLAPRVLRHWFSQPSQEAGAQPFVHIPHGTPWWHYASIDSMAVSNAEGSGVTWHRRDRSEFRRLFVASIRNFFAIRRNWDQLVRQYRDALPAITAQATWERTLAIELVDSAEPVDSTAPRESRSEPTPS